jgi:hypothetical protein
MLDFPNAPAPFQLFSAAGRSWLFDGAKWIADSFADEPTTASTLTLHATTVLPAGFTGFVWVENTSGVPVTVTLPGGPTQAQHVVVKDALGNAATLPITVNGGGVTIEGQPTLVLIYGYSWVDLAFTGTQWVQV